MKNSKLVKYQIQLNINPELLIKMVASSLGVWPWAYP